MSEHHIGYSAPVKATTSTASQNCMVAVVAERDVLRRRVERLRERLNQLCCDLVVCESDSRKRGDLDEANAWRSVRRLITAALDADGKEGA